MKIRLLSDFDDYEKGDIIDASVNTKQTSAVFYGKSTGICQVYNDKSFVSFEIVEDENQEIIDRVEKAKENIDDIPKVYGNKYTLSELKELKELLK